MADGERDPQVHVETRAQWRDWLVAHHATAAGVWAVAWRPASGKRAPSYEELVEEALCVGWVDSAKRGLDADRTQLRFTPRRAGSGWARTDKERVERLVCGGLMLPAGLQAVERACADGSWTRLDEVEQGIVAEDLAAGLDALPPARAAFDAFPPSARRARAFARHAIPAAAVLLPAAFFLSVTSADATEPNALINLAYLGAAVLTAGLLTLGVGLVRAPRA